MTEYEELMEWFADMWEAAILVLTFAVPLFLILLLLAIA